MSPWGIPLSFAMSAHRGQLRKFGSGAPYIGHPVRVAKMVEVTGAGEDTVSAALLHDVVEDTTVTMETLRNVFGDDISYMVWQLTTVKHEGENRAARKLRERNRLAEATADVQTIKLADLIDNTQDIIRFDKDFAKVYVAEKAELLSVLTKGDKGLFERARMMVQTYHQEREQEDARNA